MGRLAVVTAGQALPAPPYAADVKARGWRLNVDMEQIHNSDTWVLCPPDIRPWLLMLWLESWCCTPCGSYANNDEVIAARVGMPINLFRVHRDILLRGWNLHSDGRLYHRVVTDRVLDMVAWRDHEASRKAAWRASKKQRDTPDVTSLSQGTPMGLTTPSPSPSPRTTKTKDKGSTSSATRFGLDAMPDAWRDHCKVKRPDLDPAATFEHFSDFWRAKAGKDARKVDWFLTWKVWLRNETRQGLRPDQRSARSAAALQEWSREGESK